MRSWSWRGIALTEGQAQAEVHGGNGRVEPHCTSYPALYGQTYGYGTFTLPPDLREWRAVKLVSATITPRNPVYTVGTESYPVIDYTDAQWVNRRGGGGGD